MRIISRLIEFSLQSFVPELGKVFHVVTLRSERSASKYLRAKYQNLFLFFMCHVRKVNISKWNSQIKPISRHQFLLCPSL
ncbi:hypothetical protein ACROYT_G011797 [Oculina patagonica]